MQCGSYIDHGMFIDTINYSNLIKSQANSNISGGHRVTSTRKSKLFMKAKRRPKLKILSK